MNPLVKEYLRFAPNREGQEAGQRDGKYLPMTAAFAAEQRAKLEAGGEGSEGRRRLTAQAGTTSGRLPTLSRFDPPQAPRESSPLAASSEP